MRYGRSHHQSKMYVLLYRSPFLGDADNATSYSPSRASSSMLLRNLDLFNSPAILEPSLLPADLDIIPPY